VDALISICNLLNSVQYIYIYTLFRSSIWGHQP
jgi:hypothetical protein